jgi:hypothetical protein
VFAAKMPVAALSLRGRADACVCARLARDVWPAHALARAMVCNRGIGQGERGDHLLLELWLAHVAYAVLFISESLRAVREYFFFSHAASMREPPGYKRAGAQPAVVQRPHGPVAATAGRDGLYAVGYTPDAGGAVAPPVPIPLALVLDPAVGDLAELSGHAGDPRDAMGGLALHRETVARIVGSGPGHSRPPMAHTHMCRKCGKTGTCAYTASKRACRSPALPRNVAMQMHYCKVAGKSVIFHVDADMVPGMQAQFELNRQAARARRERLGVSA